MNRGPTWIYRLIHENDFATFLEQRELRSPGHPDGQGPVHLPVHGDGDPARGSTPVPCPPGGLVRDYVAFSFGRRGPMLYDLHRAAGDRGDAQAPLLYLLTSVEDLVAAELRFVFTDGLAQAPGTSFFRRPEELPGLDWKAIHARRWHDTPDEPERWRRKQAELLVHRRVGWRQIRIIATFDAQVRQRVRGLITRQAPSHRPRVVIRRPWYYGP